jgi:hypothetical protein
MKFIEMILSGINWLLINQSLTILTLTVQSALSGSRACKGEIEEAIRKNRKERRRKGAIF